MSEEVAGRPRTLAGYIAVGGAVLVLAVTSMALLAPWLAPCWVVRYSPSYSQVFEVFYSGRCEAAFGRLEADGAHNVEFLCKALNARDVERRRKVAMLLSTSDFGPAQLIGCMVGSLKDPDREVRIGVAAGLMLRDARQAIPMIEAARDAAADQDERRQMQSCIDGFLPVNGETKAQAQ